MQLYPVTSKEYKYKGSVFVGKINSERESERQTESERGKERERERERERVRKSFKKPFEDFFALHKKDV